MLRSRIVGKFHLNSQSSQSSQSIFHKYIFARDSTYRAIQMGIKTDRYPYKHKDHTNTKWAKDGFTYFYCMEVSRFEEIPEGMMQLTLPSSRYASFYYDGPKPFVPDHMEN